VTRSLMESMLNSCHAFPHLKDFVTLYDRGDQSGEREFHPPQCVFRELGSRKNGFGNPLPQLERDLRGRMLTSVQNAYMLSHTSTRIERPESVQRHTGRSGAPLYTIDIRFPRAENGRSGLSLAALVVRRISRSRCSTIMLRLSHIEVHHHHLNFIS